MIPWWSIGLLAFAILLILCIVVVIAVGVSARPALVSVPFRDYDKVTSAASREAETSKRDIDIVYTWVDGADENWRALKDSFANEASISGNESLRWPQDRTKDELYYSLKSVYKFFPHFRTIWIATMRPQKPAYLSEFDDRIRVVHHDEFFYGGALQPTFNSHAIEANIHNIRGLSSHFLYMNDDFFFGKPCRPSHFFCADGRPVVRGTDWPWWVLASPVVDYLHTWLQVKRLIDEKQSRSTRVSLLEHCAAALTRKMCYTARGRFRDAYNVTVTHRFRDRTDIAPIGLALHNAGTDGSATEFESDPLTCHRLDGALRTLPDTDMFCLNGEQDDVSFRVLADYFGDQEDKPA